MQLDTDLQKTQLLQVIDQTNLNGSLASILPSIQALMALRNQVEQAEVTKQPLKVVE